MIPNPKLNFDGMRGPTAIHPLAVCRDSLVANSYLPFAIRHLPKGDS